MMKSTDNHPGNPSPWTFRFLRWFCPPELLEEIEGDLIQKFEKDLNPSDRLEPAYRTGRRSDGYWRRRAKRRLIWNTIRFFRPGIVLRNKVSLGINPIDMWLQQLKFSMRVLMKEKFFSVLNILGLALGIS